jgi:catalase
VPRFVGSRLGIVRTAAGEKQVDSTVEATPSVLFDAVVVPDGDAAAGLAADGRCLEFLKDQYRHCKPILVLGAGTSLLEKAGIPAALPSGEADPGLLFGLGKGDSADAFVAAIARHRHYERETDPPLV